MSEMIIHCVIVATELALFRPRVTYGLSEVFRSQNFIWAYLTIISFVIKQGDAPQLLTPLVKGLIKGIGADSTGVWHPWKKMSMGANMSFGPVLFKRTRIFKLGLHHCHRPGRDIHNPNPNGLNR